MIFVTAALAAGVIGFAVVRGAAPAMVQPSLGSGQGETRLGIQPLELTSETPEAASSKVAAHSATEEAPGSISSLFDLLIPGLDDDRVHMAISGTLMLGSGPVERVLDLLLISKDQEVVRLCGHFLMSARDEELVIKMAGSFEAEPDAGKRGALAHALSFQMKHPRVRSIAARILSEGRTEVMEQILYGFELGDVPEVEFDDWRDRLRTVALGGETPVVRAKALDALGDDYSVEGARFMLDRLSRVSDAGELYEAAWNLKVVPWQESRSLAPEAVPALLKLVINPAADRKARWAAAQKVDSIV